MNNLSSQTRSNIAFALIISFWILFIVASLSLGYNLSQMLAKANSKNQELEKRVEALETEREILEDEIQLREDEIAYWGMKYDSVTALNKKR